MSNRPMPAHHKVVAVPISSVLPGYTGKRKVRGERGWWIVVSAGSVPAEKAPPRGMIWVIVAPARVAP